MRRTLKMLGLGLAAMLAFGALSAASASATHEQPEFELAAGQEFPEEFTGEGGAGYLITRDREHKVECNSSETKGGKITSPTEAEVEAVRFSECKDANTGASCQSGAEAGVIVTVAITGETVYWGAARANAGIWLWPTGAKGGVFAEFTCEAFGSGTDITVKGGVIGQIEIVNEPVTENTLIFETEILNPGTEEEEEVQVPRFYWEPGNCENEVLDILFSKGEGFGFGPSWEEEESAINGTATIKTPEPVTVNSEECV